MKIVNVVNGMIKYVFNEDYRFLFRASRGKYNHLPDEVFLRKYYKARFKKDINLDNPETYSEKLQWLKLHDHNPIYPTLVDKYRAKDYISKIIGEQYVVPLLGVWEKYDQIDFSKLPDQFVLKCNHDCGGIVICKDKTKFRLNDAKEKIENGLSKDYSDGLREWPYTKVKRCIIAEPYLEDEKTKELRDYKFFCFDGQVVLMFVATDRQNPKEETKFDFFDMDYNHLDLINGHCNAASIPEKPENFELMKSLASKVSQGFPHMRVDFYEVNGKVYIGELTLYHWSGLVPFKPESWDYELGKYLKVPF